jgi:hypothetical protein
LFINASKFLSRNANSFDERLCRAIINQNNVQYHGTICRVLVMVVFNPQATSLVELDGATEDETVQQNCSILIIWPSMRIVTTWR